ncbi:MAG: MarR family transcriptional regulator [Rhizobiaceae bacterium]|nr:MarR family transcriptional regulator [Rhizobiaceae bacterium]MCV0404599.1 MarR family transcriptional regulator [Rhizobiaceae bacterium]
MMNTLDHESLGFLVADVSRLIRAEIDRRITEAGLGLTPGEGRALGHAARAGEVRQSALAERMGVEAMTMSTYVDRLQARGLVERVSDPTDRRAKLVRLTPAAAETLSRIADISAGLRGDLMRDLSPDDWTHLLASLKSVRATLCELRASGRKDRDAA